MLDRVQIEQERRRAAEQMTHTERRLYQALLDTAWLCDFVAATLRMTLTDPAMSDFDPLHGEIADIAVQGLRMASERAEGETEIVLREHLGRALN